MFTMHLEKMKMKKFSLIALQKLKLFITKTAYSLFKVQSQSKLLRIKLKYFQSSYDRPDPAEVRKRYELELKEQMEALGGIAFAVEAFARATEEQRKNETLEAMRSASAGKLRIPTREHGGRRPGAAPVGVARRRGRYVARPLPVPGSALEESE